MAGGKSKATCRVAVVGDQRGFFMLPRCVVVSDAYRDLTVYARAVLIEIGVRLDGYNNGKIGVDQRSIRESLKCRPANVVRAITELMERGLIHVTAEGNRVERKAREYRLTFVSTPNGPATNDYLHWTPSSRKSGATTLVADRVVPVTTPVAGSPKPATTPVAARIATGRKTVFPPDSAVTTLVAHITKPPPPAQRSHAQGDGYTPPIPSGPRCCERCGDGFALDRDDRAYPRRFCSERCRKSAERARAYQRQSESRAHAGAGAL